MARVPNLKRLITEDFREQASWIGKLLSPLNQFMESVVSSLSNNLTFSENFNAQVKTITVDVPPTGSAFPMLYVSTIRGKPIGLWVVNAVEVASNPAVLSSAVYVDWEFINGQIKINNITGLAASKKYQITIISISG